MRTSKKLHRTWRAMHLETEHLEMSFPVLSPMGSLLSPPHRSRLAACIVSLTPRHACMLSLPLLPFSESLPSHLFSGLPDLPLQLCRYHFTSKGHRIETLSCVQAIRQYKISPPPTRLLDPTPITFHLFPQSTRCQSQSPERRLLSSWSNDTELKGISGKQEK